MTSSMTFYPVPPSPPKTRRPSSIDSGRLMSCTPSFRQPVSDGGCQEPQGSARMVRAPCLLAGLATLIQRRSKVTGRQIVLGAPCRLLSTSILSISTSPTLHLLFSTSSNSAQLPFWWFAGKSRIALFTTAANQHGLGTGIAHPSFFFSSSFLFRLYHLYKHLHQDRLAAAFSITYRWHPVNCSVY